MRYLVFLDPHNKADDLVEEIDHVPTDREEERFAQSVGYHYVGCIEAVSSQEALKIARSDYDGGGCIA